MPHPVIVRGEFAAVIYFAVLIFGVDFAVGIRALFDFVNKAFAERVFIAENTLEMFLQICLNFIGVISEFL